MSAKRKQISLSEQIEARADDIILARGFDGLSDLLATLIREEWERRHTVTIPTPSPVPEKVVHAIVGAVKREAKKVRSSHHSQES